MQTQIPVDLYNEKQLVGDVKVYCIVFVKVNLQDYDKTPKPVCAQTLKMVTGMFLPLKQQASSLKDSP